MNAEQLMQQDTISRQKIVDQTDSNFFVEAGAGSGKTTILVKRMVAMVEQGLDVSKICAITFTKAAAGEFYDRFQKALIERSTAPTVEGFVQKPGELGNPNNVTRERCLKALNDIDLCFMGTIDSFCNMILSEHPAKAGIPSNAAVLSYEDMLAQYKKAYSDIQKGFYGKDLQQLCRRFRAFHDRPDAVFLGTIGRLMDTRNCEYVFDHAPSTDVDAALKDDKAMILPVLRTLLERPELKYDNQAASRDAWDTLQAKEKLLFAPWQENVNQVMRALNTIGNIRLIPETDLGVFGASGETVFQSHLTGTKIKWFEFSEDGLKPIAKKLQDLQYSVTMEFLTAASDKIARNLRADGKLTFFDYLLYLRDTLKADAAAEGNLIKHIYDRHKYFLIDEFQDTNPMQAEVFFYLTAQNPQEDWKKCIPHPGSLFIVGDPKQSIYRFRYADVSAFLRIKKMFTGDVGEVVHLTRNFRSTHRMRSWFNRTFQALLPDTTPLQSKYELIPLEEAPATDGTFEGVYSYEVFSGKKAAPEDMDPAKVAKIIQRIVGNPAYQIRQRDDKESRMVTYQDIMLITPRKTKMGEYIQRFAEQGIPFRIEGKVLFSQCPALVTVSRIFAAIADPHSLQALIGALTCKRFGFNLNVLHRLKNEGYDFGLYAAHAEEEPISEAMAILKQLVFRSHHLSAASLFSVILEELQIFKYVSAKNLEYVYFALELLRSAECSGQFSTLPQAAAYLEMLISDASDAERAISLTRNENRVHIANLHKVKGLEAPVVILADPYKKDQAPDVRVQQQEPKPLCWIFSVRDGFSSLLACSGYEAAKDDETACLEAEKKRLLYVAATRAQRVLIVAAAINSKGESDEKNPWKFFVDRCDGDFFQELPVGEIAASPTKITVSADELYAGAKNLLTDTTSAESSYEILRPSQIKLKGKTSGEDNFEDVEEASVRTHTVRANAAVIGTLVHSLMEAMVSSRNTAPLAALAKEIASEYEAESDTYVQLLTKVGTVIQNGGFSQEGEAPQDILSALLGADEVYCEVPFCRKSGSNIWHGIMDVVYRIGDQWFILDYKTNADAHDLDVKYQEQLAAYVEAFRDLTGNTAKSLIYHIDV
ncbi:MAG: UvrD-helicase domain-containing protein [Oscillospiraceae bacterium]|nr:UvrD-helicase domain-containing protein [Oscillospiraceae bacterium]